MALVNHIAGFESSQINAEGFNTVSGTVSITASPIARTGNYSLRVNPASGANGYAESISASGVWMHFGLRITTLPSVSRVIFGFASSGVNIRLTSTGALEYREAGTTIGTTSTTLSTGQWYWIGVAVVAGTGIVIIQIDEADALTGTTTGPATNFRLGCSASEASAIDILFDDVMMDDAGFLASTKVVALQPVSDNTITSWTAGAGGGSNLFAAINAPPVGVASASETNSTNIESNSNTGTAAYTADMDDYLSAGIGSADTVLGVMGVIQHGEDISTGAKTGTVQLISNPAGASASFTFGGAGGAHGSTPTNWSATRTAVDTDAVTLGTQPTMRVTKTDTTTRVACVDYMAINVAYQPAPTFDAAALAGIWQPDSLDLQIAE